jgi:hypothetical protein
MNWTLDWWYGPLEKTGISYGKWYKNCLRPSELLDVNGRHIGFTFLIVRMTEVLTPDIYRAHWAMVLASARLRGIPPWTSDILNIIRRVNASQTRTV